MSIIQNTKLGINLDSNVTKLDLRQRRISLYGNYFSKDIKKT